MARFGSSAFFCFQPDNPNLVHSSDPTGMTRFLDYDSLTRVIYILVSWSSVIRSISFPESGEIKFIPATRKIHVKSPQLPPRISHHGFAIIQNRADTSCTWVENKIAVKNKVCMLQARKNLAQLFTEKLW